MDLQQRIIDAFKRHKETIRFCTIFTLVVGIIFYIFTLEKVVEATYGYSRHQARMTGYFVGLFVSGVKVKDATVIAKGFSAEIIGACTGIVPMLLYVSAVIAFPSGWRSKVIGILGGIGILYVANMVRLVGVFCFGMYYPAYLDVAHYYAGQSFIIMSGVAVWTYWIKKVVFPSD